MEAAVDILRKNGLAAAAKKAGRDTNEGAVAAYISEERGEKDADCAFVYGSVTPEGNLRLPGYAGQRAFVVTDRGLTYAIE